MLSFNITGRIQRRESFQFELEVQGGKVIVKHGNG